MQGPGLQGKVALVTGALTGIGRATARKLAERGAKVVASGRNEAKGAGLLAELRALGAEADYVPCDVASEADISALTGHAVTRFGRLDVAVNNAGTDGASLPLVEHTAETYAECFDTNVRGMLLCLKHQMLAMRQGGGSIVLVSSTMGHRGRPRLGLYVASKHAVEGLLKVAAIEGAAWGIRVNAIAPGQIHTPMLDRVAGHIPGGLDHIAAGSPMKRLGAPEEAADLICYLASDQASYVTGQSVAVEGGKLAS